MTRSKRVHSLIKLRSRYTLRHTLARGSIPLGLSRTLPTTRLTEERPQDRVDEMLGAYILQDRANAIMQGIGKLNLIVSCFLDGSFDVYRTRP